jgi:hypothetical protein
MELQELLIGGMMAQTPLELANFITDKSAELEFNGTACDKALDVIVDLELYPYEGEEENDKYRFTHAGLQCRVRRSPHVLTWCGYVDFLHDCHYDEIEVQIHGGLTYGNGQSVGFDCCHASDINPREYVYRTALFQDGVTYKDYNYVVEETKKLAEQLAAKLH